MNERTTDTYKMHGGLVIIVAYTTFVSYAIWALFR